MILKKTDMEEMPKSCYECILNRAEDEMCYLPMIENSVGLRVTLQDKYKDKRHPNCSLIDPLKIRYEAERIDNNFKTTGNLIEAAGRYFIMKADGIFEGTDRVIPDDYTMFEIKPETLKIVLDGEEE